MTDGIELVIVDGHEPVNIILMPETSKYYLICQWINGRDERCQSVNRYHHYRRQWASKHNSWHRWASKSNSRHQWASKQVLDASELVNIIPDGGEHNPILQWASKHDPRHQKAVSKHIPRRQWANKHIPRPDIYELINIFPVIRELMNKFPATSVSQLLDIT